MSRAFPRFLSASRLALVAGFAVVGLAGCAVGPDFVTPSAPDVAAYDASATPADTSDHAQKLKLGGDVPAAWWGLFHAPALNRLIDQAVAGNPDLEAADASLRVAQDNLAAGGGALFPTLKGNFSSTRQKTSGASSNNFAPGFYYNLHNASVNVSYTLDVFGGVRRTIEGLQADADNAAFQRRAAYLTLTGNVVTAAITEASLRDQIDAAQSVINDQEKVLKILNARLASGAVGRSAVATQQASLASVRASLPPLQHQLVVTRHLLSVLMGRLPQQDPGEIFRLSDLTLPAEVPLSVPSKLVEQRPDIRAAQENLHAASAAVGVAVAARLPDITLSADIGSMATKLENLFKPGGGFWALQGGLAETLFDAGTLADKEDAARDSLAGRAAQYRKTVLAAFQDVADTLHALQSDTDALTAKVEAEKAASESLALAQTQFDAGSIGFSELLLAETAKQQAVSALAAAKAQRYADTAALLVALGGGWWNDTAQTVAMNAQSSESNSADTQSSSIRGAQ